MSCSTGRAIFWRSCARYPERTRSASSSLYDYAAEFDGRLAALSRVQGLLSRDDEEAIAVGELVQMELEALSSLDHPRVTVDGPSVALPRQAVQLLSLALHELVTNSLKYGALNGSTGTLLIQWRTIDTAAEGRALRIDWVENGVKPASKTTSARRGFGRVLLEDALPNSSWVRKRASSCEMEASTAFSRFH